MLIPRLPDDFITDEELQAARITREAFFYRIRDHFCPILTKNSSCGRVKTGKCKACKPYLQGALKDIMPRVRVPEAVITWRLRGAAAMVGERKAVASKQKIATRDEQGFKIPNNTSFEALAKKLGI